ncbi:hypothetical protein EVAR_53199_1 [Eumeta japonica]|uniref:Uncharacterized protein n=1 Tax=Eumeta variegata TaxID=151549 RepID=A0A4C1YZL7_EUMVA|nr:hypothetical protein EVAR_53199_1 [Eumeta japonica]
MLLCAAGWSLVDFDRLLQTAATCDRKFSLVSIRPSTFISSTRLIWEPPSVWWGFEIQLFVSTIACVFVVRSSAYFRNPILTIFIASLAAFSMVELDSLEKAGLHRRQMPDSVPLRRSVFEEASR